MRYPTFKELENIVRLAGDSILQVYHGSTEDFKIQYKSDKSPVTIADKLAEKIILSELKRISPEIQIISEENIESHHLKPEETFFLIDPLDGTKEFLKRDGKGSFTVNIGLIHNKKPILGVVYAPALDRLFIGSEEEGAKEISSGFEKQIIVRKSEFNNKTAVASLSHKDKQTDDWLQHNKIQNIVSIGSSLKFCLVACGEADVYPRFGPTMEWDTAAGNAVLSAAGGEVTFVDGKPFKYAKIDYRNPAFIASGQ